MAVRRKPPAAPPVPEASDEFDRPPRYNDGLYEATTGPRDLARFLGPPSKIVNETKPYPNT